jgi:hypothetical protein
MTPEEKTLFDGTVEHFKEIARQNRFAENGAIAHDRGRCAVCNPGLVPLDPFLIYLEIVTQSIKERRPKLDQELVEELNGDLELRGASYRVTLEGLLAGGEKARACWAQWTRDALATGLGLLSVHSPTSRDFDLDGDEGEKWEEEIASRIREIMSHQLRRA